MFKQKYLHWTFWLGLVCPKYASAFVLREWQLTGEQGWRSGESARLPPMWPGFDSRARRHMWVAFVVGSLLCSERFFSGYFGFPLSSNTNISKFQFDPGMRGHILNEFLRTPRCSVGKQITITNYREVSILIVRMC